MIEIISPVNYFNRNVWLQRNFKNGPLPSFTVLITLQYIVAEPLTKITKQRLRAKLCFYDQFI